MSEVIPIACELDGPGRQAREEAIREMLKGSAEVVTRRGDGIEVRFPGGADCLPQIAELIELERNCCRFLRFELTAEPGGGPIRLTITGPEGTRAFLRSWYT